MEQLRYHSLNEYLRKTFGGKVYKLAIDGGFTCPNRDGTINRGGCIFCSEGGSGEFTPDRCLGITQQIERAKTRVEAKMPSGGVGRYIAYFQAFTNTYGPLEELRRKYSEAVNNPEIVAISIGTRPDCLGEEVVDLLAELNCIKPVWVELGLQTIHDNTAEYIRRGYSLSVYDEAVKRLKQKGIYVITHVILGLPNETKEMMTDTVKYVAASGTDGIKLQLLHVLKNTDLEQEYLAGKFRVLEEEEYAGLVRECVSFLPDNVTVHRLTGDGDKRILVAPLWSANKKHVLATLQKYVLPY